MAVAPATPTREQCDQLLVHLIDLELALTGKSHDPASATAVFDAKRDDFRAACGKTPRARVECALAGRDLDAVAKCDEPR